MSDRPSPPSSTHLGPPRKSVELEDPGAQETASGSEEEHFSDASEGHPASLSHPPSRSASPVPTTRVEKVDDNPSYGEVPGSTAYEKRQKDAVPDEIEIVPEGSRSRSQSRVGLEPALTPGGTPIPRTLVEKVDPSSPSHGEVPGTQAHALRKADATPDLVLKVPEPGSKSPSLDPTPPERSATSSPVPQTLLSRVDSLPKDGAPSAPYAHRRRPSDALPDATEVVQDAPGSPASSSTRSSHRRDIGREGPLTNDNQHHNHAPDHADSGDIDEIEAPHVHGDNDDASMNDFDEFEEGEEGAPDDDFGDFDDAFQEPTVEAAEDDSMTNITPQQPPTTPSVPPLLDFDSFKSLSDLIAATDSQFDTMFPSTKEISILPPVEPIPDSSAIFTSERSLSLWSQLVAPPPLQPPNWVKSRIRRLFLVSLGVPVDLDEILPASKQKKLVLPSIDLDGSRTSNSSDPTRSLNKQQKKDGEHNGSSTSVNSSGSATRQKSTRRRGPPPPPELDLSAVRRLCATTDAALDGLTDTELKVHVKDLEDTTRRAGGVLEYWLKRRDGLLSEKEAFEGVIENLVNHARRVRK